MIFILKLKIFHLIVFIVYFLFNIIYIFLINIFYVIFYVIFPINVIYCNIFNDERMTGDELIKIRITNKYTKLIIAVYFISYSHFITFCTFLSAFLILSLFHLLLFHPELSLLKII